MSVKKIFTVLIVVVACIIIGALVLNVLLPNVTAGLSNAVEDSIFKATGMSFNFNGDSHAGAANADNSQDANVDHTDSDAADVDGF